MALNFAGAVAAYARNAGKPADQGMAPRDADPAGSFAGMVNDSLKTAIEAGRSAEALSGQAIAGKADLTEVVTAVANAEVTLQTVLAVRDKMVQAYQDILRMPI
jgi:flagellar hook-basal body complex protein FliE